MLQYALRVKDIDFIIHICDKYYNQYNNYYELGRAGKWLKNTGFNNQANIFLNRSIQIVLDYPLHFEYVGDF